jgi:hypothetical protein
MCDCQGDPDVSVENRQEGQTHRLTVVCQRCGEPVDYVD